MEETKMEMIERDCQCTQCDKPVTIKVPKFVSTDNDCLGILCAICAAEWEESEES